MTPDPVADAVNLSVFTSTVEFAGIFRSGDLETKPFSIQIRWSPVNAYPPTGIVLGTEADYSRASGSVVLACISIRPRLGAEVALARPPSGGLSLPSLRRKLFTLAHAFSSVPSTLKCSWLNSRFTFGSIQQRRQKRLGGLQSSSAAC